MYRMSDFAHPRMRMRKRMSDLYNIADADTVRMSLFLFLRMWMRMRMSEFNILADADADADVIYTGLILIIVGI